MKTPTYPTLFAAAIGFLSLGGCASVSSVNQEVEGQEQNARRDLDGEKKRTWRLLQERRRLENELADAKDRREGVRAAIAGTADAAEKARLRVQEASLNREIASLQSQLERLSRN